jgi:hypothetical protein
VHAAGQWGDMRALLSCDHVLLMGDLNYRLQMADEQARPCTPVHDLASL